MILVPHFTLIPLDNYNNDEGREFYNSRPFAVDQEIIRFAY